MSPTCPPDDLLRRLGDDDLDARAFAELERHVEACPDCIARLESIGRRLPSSGPSGLGRPAGGAFPKIPGLAIECELGHGGMGIVYRARQEDLGRTVAVKVLPGADARGRRRALEEARAATRVVHPNVVQVYAVGEAEGLFFLVMEHIAGGSLGERAAAPISARRAAETARDVARAVAHLHAKGLVHLDLKPANILVDETTGRPVPKVADFGLARPIAVDPAGITRDGVRGTASYMAPEQTIGDGASIGPLVDVYALGATLYHLLVGRPPFQAGCDLDTMAEVRVRPPISPRRLAPGLSADLETIALKCLEKEPGRRYPSAAAVADDLDRWLDGRQIEARPASKLRRGWLVARRRPRLAAACVAMAMILPTGLGVRAEFRKLSDRGSAEAARDLESLVHLAEGELIAFSPGKMTKIMTTVDLLHGRIGRLGPDHRLDGPMVLRLSEIDGKTARHLAETGRLGEAEAVIRERLEMLRARGEALVGEDWRRRVIAGAYLDAAEIVRMKGNAASALDLLDRARETAFGSAESVGHSLSLALPMCAEYENLLAVLERGGDPVKAARAVSGLDRCREILGRSREDRVESVLLQACSLADAGDYEEADALVLGLLAPGRDWSLPNVVLKQQLHEAASAWIRSEVRRWLSHIENQEMDPSSAGVELDRTLMKLETLANRAELPRDRLAESISGEMAGQGVKRRQEGRIDRAERVAAAFRVWATALVRARPDSAAAVAALAESYSQESKNARRIDHDLHGRRTLETAIRTIRTAIDLEPENERYWSMLKGWTKRLSVLPEG